MFNVTADIMKGSMNCDWQQSGCITTRDHLHYPYRWATAGVHHSEHPYRSSWSTAMVMLIHGYMYI